jgi:hypothetical protein
MLGVGAACQAGEVIQRDSICLKQKPHIKQVGFSVIRNGRRRKDVDRFCLYLVTFS